MARLQQLNRRQVEIGVIVRSPISARIRQDEDVPNRMRRRHARRHKICNERAHRRDSFMQVLRLVVALDTPPDKNRTGYRLERLL